jgi:hypothetical protein
MAYVNRDHWLVQCDRNKRVPITDLNVLRPGDLFHSTEGWDDCHICIYVGYGNDPEAFTWNRPGYVGRRSECHIFLAHIGGLPQFWTGPTSAHFPT